MKPTTPTTWLFRIGPIRPIRQLGRATRSLLDMAPAPVLILLAIVFIHLGAALATTLFASLGVAGTAFVRLGFTALVLNLAWRPRLAHLRSDMVPLVLGLGVTLAGLNLFFYEAIARLPLGVVVMIEFLGPLGIAVASSRRPREFLWVVLAAVGIVLLAPLAGVRVDPAGFVFALAAGACWGGYIVLGGRLSRKLPGGVGLALSMALAAALLLPFGVASAGAALLRPELIMLGFAVALVSTVVPFSLEYAAMRRMSARAFGVLLSSEPAIAALVGMAALGDRLGLRQGLALILISSAALGSTLSEHKGGPDE